jgi:uncharacterized DUF497 family protein
VIVVRVDEVDWSDESIEHIARHGVRPGEVEEVVFGAPFVTRGRERTYRFVGQTEGGRFLTVIMARRRGRVFAVLTARDATREERRALRRR